jgi:hypothetical protein
MFEKCAVYRIPIDLAVTLRKLGINLKEACKQFQIAAENMNK